MYEDYSKDVINSLLYLDYDITELKIIYEYFDELINQKDGNRDFFEKAISCHREYNNKMFENIKRIKLKLEINDETELLTELDDLLKRNYDDMFVTYTEDCGRVCLKNYYALCYQYIAYIMSIRSWLINFAKNNK